MIKTKILTTRDVNQIVIIHKLAFKDAFLTSLGDSFLKLYYKSVIKSKGAVTIGLFSRNDLLGFAVGALHSNGFNKKLVIKNFISYFLMFIELFFKNPISIYRLYKNFSKKSADFDKGNYSELFSIAVLPEKSSRGLGKKLLLDFEVELKSYGAKIITLTTDEEKNDSVLSFYSKMGYHVYYKFITYPSRKMIKLQKNIK